jgi:hypothetical protein
MPQLPFANFANVVREIVTRVYAKDVATDASDATAGYTDLETNDGNSLLTCRVIWGSAEWTAYQATVQPLVNNPMPIQLGRIATHDWCLPATWVGDTLPAGHADKPDVRFVTFDATGIPTVNYVAPVAGRPRGYFARLDGTAYNAADATTYWEPRSTFRLRVSAGNRVTIVSGRVEVNALAVIPAATFLTFQAWTYADPTTGKPARPTDTFPYNATKGQPAYPGTVAAGDVIVQAACPLVAPALGMWRYSSIDVLRALASSLTGGSYVIPGEEASGPRLGLDFEYVQPMADTTAREATLDSRFGQYADITTTAHAPIATCKRAVAHFKLLTTPAL